MPSRKQFKTHEEYLEWYRNYRANRREKLREYNRIYNAKWKKEHGNHNELNWAKNNRAKCNAHQKVFYALHQGQLEKNPCEVCGNIDSVAHHDDYNKPLDVKWLCRLHHRQHHLGLIHRIDKMSKNECGIM